MRPREFAADHGTREPGRRPVIVCHDNRRAKGHPDVSRGQHRAPKQPKPRRLRTLAAGLSLAAAAATGVTLTSSLTAHPSDTGWGAPATDTTVAGDTTSTTVQPYDTGWG